MAERDVKQAPHMEGLFTWPSEEPQLIAGRCKECASYFFPRANVTHKPECKTRLVEDVLLSRRGKIQTFTIQRYPAAKPFINPDPFMPYAVGWVALPEGISIGGMMTGIDPEAVRMGMEVELVVDSLGLGPNGIEALTWKWRPV